MGVNEIPQAQLLGQNRGQDEAGVGHGVTIREGY
jgi:hypothetical protein